MHRLRSRDETHHRSLGLLHEHVPGFGWDLTQDRARVRPHRRPHDRAECLACLRDLSELLNPSVPAQFDVVKDQGHGRNRHLVRGPGLDLSHLHVVGAAREPHPHDNRVELRDPTRDYAPALKPDLVFGRDCTRSRRSLTFNAVKFLHRSILMLVLFFLL